MARTMAANLTGARLREVDQALRDARGASVVDALMKAHSHEAKVLQHLFDERRAGRPVPPLIRIARVMIWSDGAMEFRLVDSPVTLGGGPTPPSNALTGYDARHGSQRGPSGPPRPGESAATGRGPRGAGLDRAPERSLSRHPRGNDRGSGVQRPSAGALPGSGSPRLRTAWVGGTRLDPAPRQFRRRPGEDDDVNWGDAPRAGEGWSVVRPGDVLPMDPGDPPEYETYVEAVSEVGASVSVAVEAPVLLADHHAGAPVGEASDPAFVAADEGALVSTDVAAHVVAEDAAVPDSHAADGHLRPVHVDSTLDAGLVISGAAVSGREATDAVSDSDASSAAAEAEGQHHPASHTPDDGAGSAEVDGATVAGPGTDGAGERPDGLATVAPTGRPELHDDVTT